MRPRVLFVSYTSEWTGPSNSLLRLIGSLGDAVDATVLLPAGGSFRDMLDERGIATVTFPRITKRYLPRLIGVIRSSRQDLVYANTPDGTSRLAFVAARAAGAKYICHVRALGWGSRWTTLGHLRFADAVVAVSRATARSVERFVSPSRLHVVYNGISVEGEETVQTPVDLRELTGWSGDSLSLVGLANVCQRKGQAYAIEALDLIRDRVPDARLAIIGRVDREPEYAARLEGEVRRLGLLDRVSFLGFREDGACLLRQADVMVHTAMADPHPRAVLEAMAAGIPVVGFAADGVAETVVDGDTGFLVEPGDVAALAEALVLLAGDGDLRARFGAAGRRRVRAVFSDQATAAGVAQVINRVLSGRAERRPAEGRVG